MGAVLFGSDISELKAQSENAELLKSSIDQVDMRFALWDNNGTLLHLNLRMKELRISDIHSNQVKPLTKIIINFCLKTM